MSLAKAVQETDFAEDSPFAPRSDWTRSEIEALFELPFNDLMFRAQETHRAWFNANKVQLSTLLNIKSGACPEDCKYCSQSVRYETEAPVEPLMSVEEVRAAASKAKAAGASRFCMGAAWRQLRDRDVDQVGELIKTVKDLGMESCVTLGMVNERHAQKLKDAGLDYYNHNVDTSEEYYGEVITTRSYQDRLDTLENVRNAGIKVCSGGIIGMGEKRQDRAGMILTLATQPRHPESVPINMLVPIEGTPMGDVEQIDPIEFVRTVAVARICMPRSVVRLSAGRMKMSQETQTLCYMAGANSIFYGEELLTTGNNDVAEDTALFARLGIEAWNQQEEPSGGCGCSKG